MNRRLPAYRLPSLFLFCLSMASLHALPLRVLPWDDEVAARKLAIVHAKGMVELENLDSYSRTREFNVSSSEDVVVALQARDRSDKDGGPVMQPVPIPQGSKHPLLLLLPDEKSATGIRMVVLEDDPANFPWGTMRMINSTGRELVFRWEKKIVALPATWDPVKVAPGGDTRNMGVGMFLRERPDHPLYSAVWEHRQDARILVFLIPGTDPTRSPVEFKYIMETPSDLAASVNSGNAKVAP